MDTTQVATALGIVWLALAGLAGGTFKYLIDQTKTTKLDYAAHLTKAEKDCADRINRLETKLDESAQIILRQSDAQAKQIQSQQAMIDALQSTIARVEGRPV